MDHKKHQSGGSSSSSFTEICLAPKMQLLPPPLAFSAPFLVPRPRVLEETRRPTLRTQEHANSTNTEVHMEVANNQHQNTRDKGAWAKRKGIPCTKMKQQQNQAISVRLSIMVAKKFILQIPKLLALTIPSRKTEVMMMQMAAVLQGETGGKDLSTTKSHLNVCIRN
ncbi:hypothetical protein Tco_0074151 [Tanacetum coccineum]